MIALAVSSSCFPSVLQRRCSSAAAAGEDPVNKKKAPTKPEPESVVRIQSNVCVLPRSAEIVTAFCRTSCRLQRHRVWSLAAGFCQLQSGRSFVQGSNKSSEGVFRHRVHVKILQITPTYQQDPLWRNTILHGAMSFWELPVSDVLTLTHCGKILN